MESSFEGGVRGSSAVVERSVHSSLPFRKEYWNEGGDALRVAVRFYYLLKIARPGA